MVKILKISIFKYSNSAWFICFLYFFKITILKIIFFFMVSHCSFNIYACVTPQLDFILKLLSVMSPLTFDALNWN